MIKRIIEPGAASEGDYKRSSTEYDRESDDSIVCSAKRLAAVPCAFFVLAKTAQFHCTAYHIDPVHACKYKRKEDRGGIFYS